jgi:hypothetical protein
VLISVLVAGHSHAEHLVRYFSSGPARAFNTFAYFTIQSNLLIGTGALLLALDPDIDTAAFRTLRLSGLVAITVTGLVYHAVLRGLVDLKSWAIVSDQLVHTIVPVLAVAGWLLIRGAIYPWYPYPFIDVSQIGYARALVNCVWVAALTLGIAGAALGLDRRLARAGAVKTN